MEIEPKNTRPDTSGEVVMREENTTAEDDEKSCREKHETAFLMDVLDKMNDSMNVEYWTKRLQNDEEAGGQPNHHKHINHWMRQLM